MKKNERPNKEQQILEAAEQEFLTKGYDGARTTSIAEAAGVTHAMLHYYFRTKELLFERIIDEKIHLMTQSMMAVLGDPSLHIVERIKGGIEAHYDFVTENPLLPRFVINEIISRPERYSMLHSHIQSVLDVVYKDIQREIDEAVAQGEMEPVNAKMLLISIISLNLFTFIAFPFMEPLIGDIMQDKEQFIAWRKAENVVTIMRRIRKNI